MPKRCSKCKHNYANPPAAFYRNASRRDGLESRCKRCAARDQRDYNARNKDKVTARRKALWAAYYAKHRERLQAAARIRVNRRNHERKRDKARRLVTLYRLRRDNGKP